MGKHNEKDNGCECIDETAKSMLHRGCRCPPPPHTHTHRLSLEMGQLPAPPALPQNLRPDGVEPLRNDAREAGQPPGIDFQPLVLVFLPSTPTTVIEIAIMDARLDETRPDTDTDKETGDKLAVVRTPPDPSQITSLDVLVALAAPVRTPAGP